MTTKLNINFARINPDECSSVTINLMDLKRILDRLSNKIMEGQLTINPNHQQSEEIYFLIKELLALLEPINKKSNI